MGLFDRFFGRGEKKASPSRSLVANPDRKDPPCLGVLFAGKLALDPGRLTKALRACHPDLKTARVEIDPTCDAQGTPLGLAGWGEHVIQLVGFDVPMPAPVVEMCVQPSHYGADLKAQARAHQSHLLLYYAGHDDRPLEQYVALALFAALLAEEGALVVVNEVAHTTFPAKALLEMARVGDDMLESLHNLPLLFLYGGLVKYDVEGVEGVWMRTYGCHRLGLPDLALRAEGHHQGQMVFDLFNNILNYLLESGARFGVGHTMQVGPDTYLKLRAPGTGEDFLDSDGELFVAEMISADQINRPGS